MFYLLRNINTIILKLVFMFTLLENDTAPAPQYSQAESMQNTIDEAHQNWKLIIEERQRNNLVAYENYTICIGDCEYSFGLYF